MTEVTESVTPLLVILGLPLVLVGILAFALWRHSKARNARNE